jgi:hypothetical protein
MIGSAGLTTRRLPRLLCIFYLVGGIPSLVAYLFPGLGEVILSLGVIWGIWQGIILWRAGAVETAASST